jgi:uncharacterized phage protein (TIGR01671 family)
MSREIKFRAWDNENNEFLQGYFVTSVIRHDSNIIEVSGVDDESYDEPHEYPHEVILMQYTGLKDMNGVEIYEGDVVRLKDYHGERIVEISFHNGVYYYTGGGFSDEYLFNSSKREVIGNIYENAGYAIATVTRGPEGS